MTMMTKILAGGAGIAALAAAAPAAAQYYPPAHGYNPYGSYNPYAYNVSQMATQRCVAAVQARLNSPRSITDVLGLLVGANARGRVLSVTDIDARRSTIRVRGLASSGTSYGYGPYGYGAYGAMGYAYQPDLRFRCDVDYRGYVRDIDIDRRR